ncbi:MAG: C39 family peptidase [Patescibacteria group bacterium]|nr:C39 family peptidase [Patescibacteria group bacterium]
MQKTLNVPLFLQEKNSLDCGPTCVRMILAYYGINKTLKNLQSKLYYGDAGTSIFDNGALLLENKLKTNAITAQPLLFPPDKTRKLKTRKSVINLIKNKMEDKEYERFIDNFKTFLKYFEKGGNIIIEIPSFQHIKNAINNESPILALMNAQALGSNEGKFHFVVITGYKDNEVCINNPWPPSIHQGWFPIEKFLYGVHTSTCADIDNGTFIIPSK